MPEQTPDVRMYMYLTPDVNASLLLKCRRLAGIPIKLRKNELN